VQVGVDRPREHLGPASMSRAAGPLLDPATTASMLPPFT
jgi:hypothetical protein